MHLDHPAHAQCHPFIHKVVSNSLADSEGPDQTARMRRLIWAIADPRHLFAMQGPYFESCDALVYLKPRMHGYFDPSKQAVPGWIL